MEGSEKSETVSVQDDNRKTVASDADEKNTSQKSKNQDNTKVENIFSTGTEIYNPFEDVTEENLFGETNNSTKTKNDKNGKNERACNENNTVDISDNEVASDKNKSQDDSSKECQNLDAADNTNFEDDGEDLPDNFFDDFSNTDFMAGLDIVDDWIDDDDLEIIPELKMSPQETEEPTTLNNVKLNNKERVIVEKKEERISSRNRPASHRERDRHVERDNRYRSRYSREKFTRGRYSREKISKERYLRDRNSRDDRYRRNRSRDKGKIRELDRARSREHDRARSREPDRGRSREHDRGRSREYNRGRSREHDRGRSREYDRYRGSRRTPIRRRSRDYERPRKSIEAEKLIVEDSNKPRSKSDSVTVTGEENVDWRRDPEKTKRDIQKDKIRAAKDQEARVFQEQLKVAETGLVPPGTELEVVLECEKLKKHQEQIEQGQQKTLTKSPNYQRQTARTTENELLDRHKNKVYDRKRSLSPRKRSLSPRKRSLSPRKRSLSRRKRSLSPRKRSLSRRKRSLSRRKRSLSPRKRSLSPRKRSLSPRQRSLHRDRVIREEDDLRFHLREKRRRRNISDLSPVSDTRMSRSPLMSPLSAVSNLSDRETWLRNKDRRRTRFSRSCSPISSNSLSDEGLTKRKRKKSVPFKEIKFKVKSKDQPYPPEIYNVMNMNSAPAPVPTPMSAPMPTPIPAPVPLPVPAPLFQPGQMGMPFPGNQNMYMHPPEICPTPYGMQIPMFQFNQMPQPLLMTPVGIPAINEQPAGQANQNDQNSNRFPNQIRSNLKPCLTDESPELAKLFEDKKISLSDFLSVSAKSLDSTPTQNVHNRIRVIARSQEAIKVLAGNSKLVGRFFPRVLSVDSTDIGLEINPPKWRSPLRKPSTIRMRSTYTDANRKNFIENPRFFLHKLLCALRLENPVKTVTSKPKVDSATPTIANIPAIEAPPATTAPTTAATTTTTTTAATAPRDPVRPRPAKMCTVPTQTEKYKCQVCELRNDTVFVHEQTQTKKKLTTENSTQVSMDDLTKSSATLTPRSILKNNTSPVQSISHLTPAQLLAQMEKPKKEEPPNVWRKDSFKSSRLPGDRFPSNPTPGTSRQLLSSQDMFGDRPFNRNSDIPVQRNEFLNRHDQFDNNSAIMWRGNRFSEQDFAYDDYPSDIPSFMEANMSAGNRNGGRGWGPSWRDDQNRPFFY